MRANNYNKNADFTCKHCGAYVSVQKAISGVLNRNHCPYCLCSRHVDLFKVGDRLCACKALMMPVGLTLKNSRDKYAHKHQGELMLVHRCLGCGDLSINRIAADDDPEKLMAVLECTSLDLLNLDDICQAQGITLLSGKDRYLMQSGLFGKPAAQAAAQMSMCC